MTHSSSIADLNATLALAAFAVIVAAAPIEAEAQRVAAAPPDTESQRVAPYAVTPDLVVTEMLKLARVGPADYVVDLGSGDGRLVIAAVKEFGARGGFGVDIDEYLVAFANAKAKEAGIADRVQFYARDLFATDVSRATVVTVFLFPGAMPRVRDKLWAELPPGTRVVSHEFTFPDWGPERVATVQLPNTLNLFGRADAVILLYTVPERRTPGAR
jgi:SAM-dependent methyltransferase